MQLPTFGTASAYETDEDDESVIQKTSVVAQARTRASITVEGGRVPSTLPPLNCLDSDRTELGTQAAKGKYGWYVTDGRSGFGAGAGQTTGSTRERHVPTIRPVVYSYRSPVCTELLTNRPDQLS